MKILSFSLSILALFFICKGQIQPLQEKAPFVIDKLQIIDLSDQAKELLKKNGFVITPSNKPQMSDIYIECKEKNQPIFVTTDAILHTSHILFNYILRIIEKEKLYPLTVELTDKMLALSIQQFNEAKNKEIKELARLNIGFFSVAKKLFNPDYVVEFNLDKIVKKELINIENHEGPLQRELLTYIEKKSLSMIPYAYEDYSQYVPRGHYTRNVEFEKYFKVMMWFGRIDFKLKPSTKEPAITHGKKMTLQAILITDALLRDTSAYNLWKKIYEPTVYFVGKTDDLCADDYIKLIKEIFLSEKNVDKYADDAKLIKFIEEALKLHPPKILSGAAYVEDDEFASQTIGFRFMGQRFIPDSYIFQELVFGVKNKKLMLKYTGKGDPFTKIITDYGPVRGFPRGLDILAVLGSKRALEILEKDGDTEYTDYYEQLNKLKEEFSSKTIADWQQNLYWRWLYALLPLLKEPEKHFPAFMLTPAWIDKELQTALGSWTELRHDVILYAKQSYTMMTKSAPMFQFSFGYVEPYPEVYSRLAEMMNDLRNNLITLQITTEGIPEKIKEFEELLLRLKTISEKELAKQNLADEEYKLIWNIGSKLSALKRFPRPIMEKIGSVADNRMDIIADVHTVPQTQEVLEVGVGSPFNIYVIVNDSKGERLCRGAVFSYFEFKQPMKDRLTDEKWQEMGDENSRPEQPKWIRTITME